MFFNFWRLNLWKTTSFQFIYSIEGRRLFKILLRKEAWRCFEDQNDRDFELFKVLLISKRRFWGRRLQDRRRKRKKRSEDSLWMLRKTHGRWRPSCFQKVFMRCGQYLLISQEITRRSHGERHKLTDQRIQGRFGFIDVRKAMEIRVFIYNSCYNQIII